MLRRDYANRAHIVQPSKKKRISSVIAVPMRQHPSLEALDNDKPNIKQYKPIQTPQAETEGNDSLVVSVASTNLMNDSELIFDHVPSLLELSESEMTIEFLNRVQQCTRLCNFSNPNIGDRIKDKTKTLEDMILALKRTNIIETFGNEEYQYIFRMVLRHMNRSVPQNTMVELSFVDPEMAVQFNEEEWDHVNLIYDILCEILVSRKFNQRLCNASQLAKLSYSIVNMFSSPDQREREKLCKVFHHHYVTMVSQRSLIRKYAGDFFVRVTQGIIKPIGVAELISAYMPVVSGFKVPLLQSHVVTYNTVFLPLHKCQYLSLFHVQLVNIITVYAEKQRSLIYQAMRYILSIWPKTAPVKEINFVLEIGHFIEITSGDVPSDIIIMFAKRVAVCATSLSFTVCERTMMMWQSDIFGKCISMYAPETFRIILPALYKTFKEHWCEEVKSLATTALITIKQSNPAAFDMVSAEIRTNDMERINTEKQRIDKWKAVAQKASLPKKDVDEFVRSMQAAAFSFKGI